MVIRLSAVEHRRPNGRGNSNPRVGTCGYIAATDKFISDFFGDNGFGNFYECHSCEAPGYIDRLIRDHQIGLIDGEWVGFEMIWPTTHGHANKQIVEIPLERLVPAD